MNLDEHFDCVEMKHRGAEKVQERLAAMTREEQLIYWRESGRELEKLRQEVIARKRVS